jgi:dimethylglycine dehydrogenase
VLLDGAVVGSTASVAYGHTVGKILAFAYVKPQAATPGTALGSVVMNGSRGRRRCLPSRPMIRKA